MGTVVKTAGWRVNNGLSGDRIDKILTYTVGYIVKPIQYNSSTRSTVLH